jgi:CubicO group peptidase (beta-lactamase class C family)
MKLNEILHAFPQSVRCRKIPLTVLLAGLTLTVTTLLNAKLWAVELPEARPEEVGMSTEGLEHIHEMLQGHIDAGTIQGAVTAVARRGKVVHFEAHGLMNVEAKEPMTKDAIFRMASSTKPIVGVAVMMMIQEGKIQPSDEVHKYIPEFIGMKVAVPKDGKPFRRARGVSAELPEYDLVPVERDITISDLLTHTSGLKSGGLGNALSRQIRRGADDTLATYIPKLGEVPLDFQPGSRWSYSPGTGIDVLGRIVEIVSDQPLDEFLRQRIFEPLGMNDTFFNLPEDKRSQLVTMPPRPGANETQRSRPPRTSIRKYFSGSGGLVSSAEDYLRFEQMLCNNGELLGNRILSPEMVKMMAANHVGDLYKGLYGNQGDGLGYGYTVAIVLDSAKSGSQRSNGAIGWGGAYGTMSWTDFEEDLTGVIMLQQPVQKVKNDFEKAVRQAIID